MTAPRHCHLIASTVLLAFLSCRGPATGQAAVYPDLARQIAAIPAIGNHAHPPLSPPAPATDRGFDTLPVDSVEPQTDPAGMRPTLPALHEAWKAIFAFEGQSPLTPEAQKQLDLALSKVTPSSSNKKPSEPSPKKELARMVIRGNAESLYPSIQARESS